jgi:hypothetical protein
VPDEFETIESIRRDGMAKLRDQIHERLVRFCDEEFAGDLDERD